MMDIGWIKNIKCDFNFIMNVIDGDVKWKILYELILFLFVIYYDVRI